MSIDYDNEKLITIHEAARAACVSDRTVRNWYLVGMNGVKLDVTYLGKRPLTSREALRRFADAQTHFRLPPPPSRSTAGTQSRQAQAAKKQTEAIARSMGIL